MYTNGERWSWRKAILFMSGVAVGFWGAVAALVTAIQLE